jgi:O-antigen/teichoic acid export membrane protein
VLKYLFKHSSNKQILLKNTFWLSGSTLIGRLAKFFLVTQSALLLSPEGYGTFIYLFSTIQLFFGISDLGVSSIFKRDYQNDDYDKGALVGSFFLIKIITVTLYTLGALSLLVWWPKPLVTTPFLILIAVTALTQLYVGINTYFLARNRFEIQSIVTLSDMWITTGVGLYALHISPSLVSLSLAYLTGTAVAFIISLSSLLVFLRHSLSTSFTMIKHIIREAAPSSGANVIVMLLNTMDVIIIEHFLGAAYVGYYSVAQRCYKLTLNIPQIFKATLLPVMSSLQNSVNDLAKLLRKSTMILLIISIPGLVGGILLAEPIITFLFSKDYAPAVPALQLFFLSLPVMFLVGVYVQSLIVIRKQHLVFVFSVITSFLNLTLSVLLVTPMGISGVCLASLISLTVGFILPFKVMHNYCEERLFSYRQLIPIVAGSSIMGATVYYAQPYFPSVYVLVGVGCGVYLCSLILFKEYHTTALLQDIVSKLRSKNVTSG